MSHRGFIDRQHKAVVVGETRELTDVLEKNEKKNKTSVYRVVQHNKVEPKYFGFMDCPHTPHP